MSICVLYKTPPTISEFLHLNEPVSTCPLQENAPARSSITLIAVLRLKLSDRGLRHCEFDTRNGSLRSHGGQEGGSGSCWIESYVGTWLKCSSAVSSGYKDSRDDSGTRLVTRLCVFPYVAVQNTSCYFRFRPSALMYVQTDLGDEKEQMLIERGRKRPSPHCQPRHECQVRSRRRH